MKKADSVDPAKYPPEMFKIDFTGATGKVQFDDKGDRKDAEMTIFKLKDGKVVPIAIVKNGETKPFSAAAPASAAPRSRTRGTGEATASEARERRNNHETEENNKESRARPAG